MVQGSQAPSIEGPAHSLELRTILSRAAWWKDPSDRALRSGSEAPPLEKEAVPIAALRP